VDTSVSPSGSPTYPLDVVAALSADKKRMAISVVRPTESTQDCVLSLTGVQASGPARLWQLTPPADAAASAPPPGRSPFGFGPPAKMAEITLPEAPRRISLPPASMTVFEFDLR